MEKRYVRIGQVLIDFILLFIVFHFLVQIAELDATLAKVKVEDTRLCNTLEYLKSQQKDFESFLKPIEDSLPVNIAAEPEREQL